MAGRDSHLNGSNRESEKCIFSLLKTTPIPKKTGSYGIYAIEVGVRMPFFGLVDVWDTFYFFFSVRRRGKRKRRPRRWPGGSVLIKIEGGGGGFRGGGVGGGRELGKCLWGGGGV